MESTFQKIVRKSGFKPVECKCNVCKTQCIKPCFGTPEDMEKIIAAGHQKRVQAVIIDDVPMITPLLDASKGACTFFTNGLCELHDSGLKPTVGKLAHHSTTLQNFNIKKSPSKLVMDEWKNMAPGQFEKYVSTNFK